MDKGGATFSLRMLCEDVPWGFDLDNEGTRMCLCPAGGWGGVESCLLIYFLYIYGYPILLPQSTTAFP